MNANDFSKLYHEHYGLLYFWMLNRIHNKEQAEDIASTAFMKAWSERRTLKDHAKLKSWLYAIAMNELRQSFRVPVSEPLEEKADPRDFTKYIEQNQEAEKLVHAMPEFLNQFARGLTVKRLAQKYKIPTGTVLSRLYKERKQTQWRLTYEMSNV